MAKNKGIDWDAHPLGAMSDAALARRLGVSKHSVQDARSRRRIRACRPVRSKKTRVPVVRKPVVRKPRSRIDWGSLPLGEVSDARIASVIGLGVGAVWAARKRMGVAACFPRHGVAGRSWDENPVATETDRSIARRLGLNTKTVKSARQLRGISSSDPRRKSPSLTVDWGALPMGKLSDRAIGQSIGVSRGTVAAHRRAAGIGNSLGNWRIDWSRVPLGRKPDQQIAESIGTSRETVTAARERRSIGRAPQSMARRPLTRAKPRPSVRICPCGKEFVGVMSVACSDACRQSLRRLRMADPDIGECLLLIEKLNIEARRQARASKRTKEE